MCIRDSFKAEEGFSVANRFKQLKASDLKADSAMRYMLRKPDFQRETRDWSIAPVSYTHLDVYKRQIFCLLSFGYPEFKKTAKDRWDGSRVHNGRWNQ